HFATSNHFSFFFSDFATPMQLAKLFISETENLGKTGGFPEIYQRMSRRIGGIPANSGRPITGIGHNLCVLVHNS
ncbi:MAG: hypothetical protein RIQ67_1791, partial [Pseudomonadota bacterium]